MGSRSGAERSKPAPFRRGAMRGSEPPIALGALKEKDNSKMPMNGPPMIQTGMKVFMSFPRSRLNSQCDAVLKGIDN
jgi:hypothetical protein